MAVTDHTLRVGDAVQLIAGAHRGHAARLVELGDASSSRHTVRCLEHPETVRGAEAEDGETLRVSKAHVQRAENA